MMWYEVINCVVLSITIMGCFFYIRTYKNLMKTNAAQVTTDVILLHNFVINSILLIQFYYALAYVVWIYKSMSTMAGGIENFGFLVYVVAEVFRSLFFTVIISYGILSLKRIIK